MPEYYNSPRWSQEIPDCSMPMTFDTYSRCSYNCLYCFAVFRKSVGAGKQNFRAKVRHVNVEAVKQIFTVPHSSEFWSYVQARRPMQWGGMSDPFDEHERRLGVTLQLLQFFRSLQYPLCFSTKGAWWAYEPAYREAFAGMPWNVKISIITLDGDKARKVERGVPSPQERLDAMRQVAGFAAGGVTLRLRPFVLGVSDGTYLDLIRAAADAGATAVSTEFFCMDVRTPLAREKHYPAMSEVCGFDLVPFYRKYSTGSGYLRLNRNIKRPYIDKMDTLCAQLGLRFYVSDAHFKERCSNGSCCGLPADWHYSRGQFCEALCIAKERGEVRWADIEADLAGFAKGFLWRTAQGYNPCDCEHRAAFIDYSMYDYIRYLWNHPKKGQSPYKMFEGILVPDRLDDNGDIVYKWNAERA